MAPSVSLSSRRSWLLWTMFITVLLGIVALFYVLPLRHLFTKQSTSSTSPSATPETTVPPIREELVKGTQDLQESLEEFEKAEPSEQAVALAELTEIATERRKVMVAAMEEDPTSVIEQALTPEEKDRFPTEVQTLIEEEVVQEGEYNLQIGDDFEEDEALYAHALYTGEPTLLQLHPTSDFTLAPGTDVEVAGIKVDNDVAVQEISPTQSPISFLPPAQVQGVFTNDANAAPVATVPAYNSLPGATKTLHLDFDGHIESGFGWPSSPITAPFDIDGNPSNFSDSEQTIINQTWQAVAEDFAPYNVNVTTVAPSSFADGVAQKIAIGGRYSDWYGPGAAGVCWVGGFTNFLSNTCFVFSTSILEAGAGVAYIADTVSHEAGHSFGLQHQSQWSGATKVAEYYAGSGDGRRPIMGHPGERALWWSGIDKNGFQQDDMALLNSASSGINYRSDDHSNSISGATAYVGENATTGIIGQTSDIDYFATTLQPGTASFKLTALESFNNLDAKLELRNSAGEVLATQDDVGFGAKIITTIQTAGTYFITVASHGGYGDVGQYRLTDSHIVGTPTPTPLPTSTPVPVPPPTPVPTPTPTPTPSPTATPTATPNPNPVAYWKMDETTNDSCSGGLDVCDSAGRNYHGTVQGSAGSPVSGPAISDLRPTLTFTNTKARSFDGVDDYVAIPAAPFEIYPTSASTTAYQRSFTTWFKTNGNGVILGQTGSSAAPPATPNGWVPALYIDTAGKLRSSLFWHNGQEIIVSATSYNDSRWHHVALVYDAGVETAYVDGSPIGSITAPQHGYASTYSYFLGTGYTQQWPQTNNGWFYFNGLLDDVRVYERGLSASEVAQLAVHTTPTTTPTSLPTITPTPTTPPATPTAVVTPAPTLTPTNNPPVISVSSSAGKVNNAFQVRIGQKLTLTTTAADPDSSALTLLATNLASFIGAVFAAATSN